jgi:hypothetical protein
MNKNFFDEQEELRRVNETQSRDEHELQRVNETQPRDGDARVGGEMLVVVSDRNSERGGCGCIEGLQ